MKAAEQWVEEWTKDPEVTFGEIIEQAQKEAYNQAIDDAVNNVKVMSTKKLNFETGKWENIPLIDQTSILKLKK